MTIEKSRVVITTFAKVSKPAVIKKDLALKRETCHWQPNLSHQLRYGTLEYAKQCLDQFHYRPKKILKRLHLLNRCRSKKEARRVAIVRIMKVILHYTDMRTLQIGVINPDKSMWLPTLAWLAEKACIGLKRAQRAIRDLARAQYLKISYRWTQRKDGSYINKAALREIRPSFFKDLGVKAEQVRIDQSRAQFKVNLRQHTAVQANNFIASNLNTVKAALQQCRQAIGKGRSRGSPQSVSTLLSTF